MRLSEFLRQNTGAVLSEWENFARTLPSAATINLAALRDHAKEMLLAIAADLDQSQTPHEQFNKARGRSDAARGDAQTPAQSHGADRAITGFGVDEMIAEFRALRASVISLWLLDRHVDMTDQQDMIRFNEAIDQAIAESITRFSADIAATKDRFIAILGHDLKTPLNAILTSTIFMLERGELVEPYRTLLAGISTSARRMNDLVLDLTDFTRTRFGDAFPIVLEQIDLRLIVHAVVAEIAAAHPESTVQIETSGLLRGKCDPHRLTQALTNLVANAAEHGTSDRPIKISAHGIFEQCIITVQNFGPVIPPERIATLFQPMSNGTDRRHLGLGLYIAEKIVVAHGGKLHVTSDAEHGTIIEMHLPL